MPKRTLSKRTRVIISQIILFEKRITGKDDEIMLERKKKTLSKKMGVFTLILSLFMLNGIFAFAESLSGTTSGIKYKFVGNAVQSGVNMKVTGSTEADISLKKKTNYVEVEASKEYTNASGVKSVATVKTVKKTAATMSDTSSKKVTLPTQYIPKALNGKPVTARVSHAFLSNGVSYFAHTVR